MRRFLAVALVLLWPGLAGAFLLTGSPPRIILPAAVSLDSVVFTGCQIGTPNGGDTIIANITGCTGPGDCALGGADASKFKVIAPGDGLVGGACPSGQQCPGGWTNSNVGGPRKGPFLMSAGNQSGQPGGYDITLNGTPFHLGDPHSPSVVNAVIVNPGDNIQAAIDSASPGQPIFLRCGNYSGGFSANGHNVISATVQNPINGESCRAVISSGPVDFSNAVVYGVDVENCANPCFQGSNGTIKNVIGNVAGNGNQALCQGGNVKVRWSSFPFSNGIENGCGGGVPVTFDHIFMYYCYNDCNGGDYSGNGTFTTKNSFFNINSQDHAMANLGSAIEDGTHNGTSTVVNNNYVLNGGNGSNPQCCGGYGWSLIYKNGTTGQVDFHYNYTAGMNTILELNVGPGPNAGHFDDNYFDWLNFAPSVWNQEGIFFPFSLAAAGVGTTIQRNKEIPFVNDVPEGSCPGTCGTDYIAGDSINVGIPAPFASGAGP